MNKLRAVYIEWEDSCTIYGWRHPDDAGTSLIKSVGILVERTAKHITITTSQGETGNSVDQMSIPATAIRKIRRIKL